MSSIAHRQREKTQTGAVLVVSLLFLVLMMLIGLTGMQVTSLEEKMSGNMRDRNLAFQAAESALRDGEKDISAVCTPGVYRYNDIDCDLTPEDAQIWDDWSSLPSTISYSGYGSLASLASGSAPAYIIEEMPFICDTLEVPCPKGSRPRRVTARATGGTTDAVVMVQSTSRH